VAALTLATSSCAGIRKKDVDSHNFVRVTLNKQTYLAGETLTATVNNTSEVTLVYPWGFCKTVLQRQDQSGIWKTITPVGPCGPLALKYLGARASVAQNYSLPGRILPGLYRLVMPAPRAEVTGRAEEMNTAPFNVTSTVPPEVNGNL
jgi:hypothetical protein